MLIGTNLIFTKLTHSRIDMATHLTMANPDIQIKSQLVEEVARRYASFASQIEEEKEQKKAHIFSP